MVAGAGTECEGGGSGSGEAGSSLRMCRSDMAEDGRGQHGGQDREEQGERRESESKLDVCYVFARV